MLLEFKPTGNYFRVVPIQGITLKISEESKVRVIPSLSAKVHSGLSNVYDVCKPVCFFFFTYLQRIYFTIHQLCMCPRWQISRRLKRSAGMIT